MCSIRNRIYYYIEYNELCILMKEVEISTKSQYSKLEQCIPFKTFFGLYEEFVVLNFILLTIINFSPKFKIFFWI